jgi:hypothetical protein
MNKTQKDLSEIAINKGMSIEVHSSMKAIDDRTIEHCTFIKEKVNL